LKSQIAGWDNRSKQTDCGIGVRIHEDICGIDSDLPMGLGFDSGIQVQLIQIEASGVCHLSKGDTAGRAGAIC
jgi:hypothetical protein